MTAPDQYMDGSLATIRVAVFLALFVQRVCVQSTRCVSRPTDNMTAPDQMPQTDQYRLRPLPRLATYVTDIAHRVHCTFASCI